LAAKVYASLAHELLTLQRSSEALAFYNDAVKIVDTIQDLRSLADHYLTRAAEAHTQGDATTSYNLARDGLALLIALDSMHDAHQIYASFGQLLASTGDAAQVESYLIQGLEIARRVNIPQDIVTSATSLADLYLKRGDIVQAEHYILEALREAQDHGGPREEAQATLSLAAIADAQGRQSDAAAHYEKAIQLLEALGPSDLLSMAYFRYGQALVAWGDTVRGSQYLEKAYLHKG
jgi:tetratricopeptide (TPR) repeat protein